MNLLTKQEIETLLDRATQGPFKGQPAVWYADWHSPEETMCDIRVVGSEIIICEGVSKRDAALLLAAPDIARTALDALARLEDAEARGMEMAIKTYRTGAGVDNGNYPLWAYDADYEAAVRKKAEVHRKAASDRAGRKET